jgi:hypothetical protein
VNLVAINVASEPRSSRAHPGPLDIYLSVTTNILSQEAKGPREYRTSHRRMDYKHDCTLMRAVKLEEEM